MPSLADVERLVDPDDPITKKTDHILVHVYFSRRSYKRWCEVMPPRSMSWFVRESVERFLDEIEELPKDAIARVCRLIAHDLTHKRFGPILKKHIRT